jgi:hypothetical protein
MGIAARPIPSSVDPIFRVRLQSRARRVNTDIHELRRVLDSGLREFKAGSDEAVV